jgi:hypothetical protein
VRDPRIDPLPGDVVIYGGIRFEVTGRPSWRRVEVRGAEFKLDLWRRMLTDRGEVAYAAPLPDPSPCGCCMGEDGAIRLCEVHELTLPAEVFNRRAPTLEERPIRLRNGRLV